jgi:hypothetical protein
VEFCDDEPLSVGSEGAGAVKETFAHSAKVGPIKTVDLDTRVTTISHPYFGLCVPTVDEHRMRTIETTSAFFAVQRLDAGPIRAVPMDKMLAITIGDPAASSPTTPDFGNGHRCGGVRPALIRTVNRPRHAHDLTAIQVELHNLTLNLVTGLIGVVTGPAPLVAGIKSWPL